MLSASVRMLSSLFLFLFIMKRPSLGNTAADDTGSMGGGLLFFECITSHLAGMLNILPRTDSAVH